MRALTIFLRARSQADPEPSIGEYLLGGMARFLGLAHKRLKLAPFKPKHAGKVGKEVARVPMDVIGNKFFNARHYPCKRIVLSEEFKPLFSEKLQGHIRFVPPLDSALEDNERNSAMRHFVALCDGSAVRAVPVFPDPKCPKPPACAADKENGSQEPPAPHSRADAPPAATGGGSAPPAPAALTAAEVEALGAALRPLDGAAFEPAVGDPPPKMPKAPVARQLPSAYGPTKKAKLQEKRAAAATKRARGGVAKPKSRVPDSSDEEDKGEVDEEEADDDEAESGLPKGRLAPPPLPPPPRPKKQAKLSASIKLAEVALDDAAVSRDAVEPPLEPKNAATRFIFVPASEFGTEGIGGWVAKITKVGTQKDPTTDIQFKDAESKLSKLYFKFSHVAATFKPLS
jgi:hypothetical protein